MSRRSRDSVTETPPAASPSPGFRAPERAAQALCDAILAIAGVHRRGQAEVLGRTLLLLAREVHDRGLDVPVLLARAAARPLPPGTPPPATVPGDLNERLSVALTQAVQALLQVCDGEMERGGVNEELFRAVLAAELFERITEAPRDPSASITAALPRDTVLDLMYGLTWQRQHAEDVLARRLRPELRDEAREELRQTVESLREAGCEADVDLPMGFGIALWRPRAVTTPGRGAQGLVFSLGRSTADDEAWDFVVRFDPADPSAREHASRLVYRAHLAQRRRPGRGSIEVDGLMLRAQPMAEADWQALLDEAGIDPQTLHGSVRRVATLDLCASATERLFRSRLAPAGGSVATDALPASTTMH